MARVSISPNTKTMNHSLVNLLCKEYCEGTLAVCYCPQCAAIFCAECFNKEHQSERKMFHEKMLDVRPICEEHHHTLEYFDLTSFQPLCIMCLTRLHIDKELQFHVVQSMAKVSNKLYTLLTDKIYEAKNIVKSVEKEAPNVKKITERTVQSAKDEVHSLIDKFKTLLDEREKELMEDLDGIEQRYLQEDKSTGLLSLKQRLEDSIERAAHLVQSQQHETIGFEFPHCYNKLNDLCAIASKRIESKNELQITIDISKPKLLRMSKLIDVGSEVKGVDDSDSDGDDINLFIKDDLKPQVVKNSNNCCQETEEENHHGNAIDDVDLQRTVTPTGDADFCDNTTNNNDVAETMVTSSEIDTHHDNAAPSVSSMETESMTSTPRSRMSAGAVKKVRRVAIDEGSGSLDRPQNKRACRKRKARAIPQSSDDDSPVEDEWSPGTKRILRSNCHEKSTQTRMRRGGALIKEINQCDYILTELWADDDSWPFVRLVDKKKCPEYYQKIKNPMSLEIVKEKLHSYKYRSVMEFIKDMEDIFENCRTFNPPDTEVYQSGMRLSQQYKTFLFETFPNVESVLHSKLESSFET